MSSERSRAELGDADSNDLGESLSRGIPPIHPYLSHQEVDRRGFLKSVAATTAVSLLSQPTGARAATLAERLHIGAQTNAWGVPIKEYTQLLKIAETLVRLGYQGFETNFASVSSQADRAGEVRRDLEARHIHFVAPHAGGTFYDREKAAEEESNLLHIATVCAQMGASYLIVSGRALPHKDGKFDVDALHTKAQALNRLGAAVQKVGLRLCYHNHEPEFRDHPTEMSYLLSETDPEKVWLCLDVGHVYGLADPAEFTAANFRRIAIFHLRDGTRSPDGKFVYSQPGKGKINLKGIVAPLMKSNWEGWLEIEMEEYYPKPMPDPEQSMREWREYLRVITGV
jgi:sugar phosphate isomerase/epimerase